MKPMAPYGQHHLISLLFVGSASLVFVGILMFNYRVFLHGRLFPEFVRWERSLVALGALIGALAFAFLTTRQWSAGERVVSSAAWGVLALGTALVVFAEVRVIVGLASTLEPSKSLPALGGANPLILLGVALTFIGQAMYGISLLQTPLPPAWAGWLLLAWNLGWLVVVFLFSARDPYYPVLFCIGPVVLSVLLWR